MHSPVLTSRNGEDQLLLSVLDPAGPGFFIDVGALDGVHGSITYALEQCGWHGYCLEPSPGIFPGLVGNRPDAVCIEAAAGPGPGRVQVFPEPSASPGAHRGRSWGVPHLARALSLDDLLRRHAPPVRPDVVVVSAAAGPLGVLAGFDLEQHRPQVLVLGSDDAAGTPEAVRRCAAAGYELARTLGESLFLTGDRRLADRLRRTPVTCVVTGSEHPLGMAYTQPGAARDRVVLDGATVPLVDLRPASPARTARREAESAS